LNLFTPWSYNDFVAQREVFSEQEVTDIIRRAAELSEGAVQSQPYSPGVTRAELEKIAAEIGVDPRSLEQAILDSRQSNAGTEGLRLAPEYERVVEGELDPSEFDLVTDFIRTASRFGPGVSQVGRSVNARAWAGPSKADVNITSRNGRTKIKVRSSPLIGLIAGGYGAFVTSILSAPALAEAGQYGLAFAAVAASVLVGGGVGTWLIKRGQSASRKLADQLRDRIEETLSSKDQNDSSHPGDEDVPARLRQE